LVGHSLIHMDGTRIQGPWEDLTGAPHALSTPTHILQYGQEFRGALGQIGLLGIHEFVLPFTAGVRGTPYAQHSLDLPYFEGAHAQGGIAATGPMLSLTVDAREPGDEIVLSSGDPTTLAVRAEATSFTPIDSLQVLVDGRPFVSGEDVRFLRETVDAIWNRVEDSDWRTPEAKAEFYDAVEAARDVYRRLEEEAVIP
jgi:hypothetical protein